MQLSLPNVSEIQVRDEETTSLADAAWRHATLKLKDLIPGGTIKLVPVEYTFDGSRHFLRTTIRIPSREFEMLFNIRPPQTTSVISLASESLLVTD